MSAYDDDIKAAYRDGQADSKARIERLEAALRECARRFDEIATWREGALEFDADMDNPPRTFCEDVELIEQSAKEAADTARALLQEAKP